MTWRSFLGRGWAKRMKERKRKRERRKCFQGGVESAKELNKLHAAFVFEFELLIIMIC